MKLPRRRYIGALSDALYLGLQIGEQRRQPTPEERAAFAGSPRLRRSFEKGIGRGRRRAARLQQCRLELK